MTSWSGSVVRVVDGDTLDVVALDDPLGVDAGEVVRVRLVGIDAPEMPTQRGRRARRRLSRWCPPGAEVTVTPAAATDPHRRLLATVTIDVGKRMLTDGYARRWT